MSSAFTIFCICFFLVYMHCSFTQRARADQILHTIYNLQLSQLSGFPFWFWESCLSKSWQTEVWRSARLHFPMCFFSHRSPHGNCWTGLFGWHCVLMQRDGKQIIPWPMTYRDLKWIGKGRWRMALRCGKPTIQYVTIRLHFWAKEKQATNINWPGIINTHTHTIYASQCCSLQQCLILLVSFFKCLLLQWSTRSIKCILYKAVVQGHGGHIRVRNYSTRRI